MKHTILASMALLCATSASGADLRPEHTLWYDTPALQWEETLPVGNGRMGMMPYGNPRHEHVVLNEISMWSGSRACYDNPEAADSLPEIQCLLLEGRNKEAQELMYRSFVPHKPTEGGTYGSYQVLAHLNIDLSYGSDAAPEAYTRRLDLSEACAYTAYSIAGTDYVQECYVPRGSDVMVWHIKASAPGAVSFTAGLSRPERGAVRGSAGRLMLEGELDSGAPGVAGVRYALVAGTAAAGAGARQWTTDSTLCVAGATEAWIVMGAATSYLYGELYATQASTAVSDALGADLAALKAEGIAAHRSLYDRAELRLAANDDSALPTRQRIERFAATGGADAALAALYYNYGRYLLICSTLPGVLPPNLQGLWANEVGTPWNGDYHTNINVQMNHWPAEPGNLSELHGPLIDLVKRSVAPGEHTARTFYGPDARGWVMHMMTNVWGYTDPGEHPSWGATNTGGAWLCAHLWEHWLYTADRDYLAEIYPVMKGAAEFFRSTMIREPGHGWLVTAPSSSPENTFYTSPDDTTPVSICMGPTMDSQLVRELYTNVAAAARELGIDSLYADSLQAEIALLPPSRAGSDGRLMEWLEEYREVDPHHRHVSHLYGLHPGNQISAVLTPELADACRATLEARGDGGTGWSRAWKVNFWARLGDGDRAYKLFQSLLSPAYTADAPDRHGPGTFPNLFCSHPPFQMDGNWGGAAGVGEMLLQSQDGFINPLPALPAAWPDGELRGFKVRGGATVDMAWADGRLTWIAITGGPVAEQRLRLPDGTITTLTLSPGERLIIHP